MFAGIAGIAKNSQILDNTPHRQNFAGHVISFRYLELADLPRPTQDNLDNQDNPYGP